MMFEVGRAGTLLQEGSGMKYESLVTGNSLVVFGHKLYPFSSILHFKQLVDYKL